MLSDTPNAIPTFSKAQLVSKSRLTLAAMSMMALPTLAMAQEQAAPNPLVQFLFLGGFILLFYFLLWRPQSKRAKEHRQLIAGLDKGDEVVTSGGIAGRIVRVKDDFVVIQVAEGVEVKVQKVAVAAALPKGTLKEI